jgi:hypothetical protein
MRTYPYQFHIALDGNGINGLEGMAGVCSFLFDPADDAYAYKINYHDGLGGGHAVNVSPDGKTGYLGTAGQHLALYDPSSLDPWIGCQPCVSRKTIRASAAVRTWSG